MLAGTISLSGLESLAMERRLLLVQSKEREETERSPRRRPQ